MFPKRIAFRTTLTFSAATACVVVSCSASSGSSSHGNGIGAGGSTGYVPISGGASSAGGDSSSGGLPFGGAPGSGGASSLETGSTGSSGAPATGGTTGLPGDGGTRAPYPYDPNVTFDWPETVSQGPCLPGHYEGTFTCQLDFIPGFPGTPITGPVAFNLEESDNGEFLVIKDGTLNGVAQTTIKFNSPLSGQLDCSQNKFHADATQGTYSDGLFITGTFQGGLDATLDRGTQVLTGTWDLAPSATGTPCAGAWSATRKP